MARRARSSKCPALEAAGPANGNRFHTVASVNPWIGQVSAHGYRSVRVHALLYTVCLASWAITSLRLQDCLPAMPRTPPANPSSGDILQGRRYPSQMHASTECYPRDGSRPALHLHVQPPVCGFLACTNGPWTTPRLYARLTRAGSQFRFSILQSHVTLWERNGSLSAMPAHEVFARRAGTPSRRSASSA